MKAYAIAAETIKDQAMFDAYRKVCLRRSSRRVITRCSKLASGLSNHFELFG
jgi:hypothetical protein